MAALLRCRPCRQSKKEAAQAVEHSLGLHYCLSACQCVKRRSHRLGLVDTKEAAQQEVRIQARQMVADPAENCELVETGCAYLTVQ